MLSSSRKLNLCFSARWLNRRPKQDRHNSRCLCLWLQLPSLPRYVAPSLDQRLQLLLAVLVSLAMWVHPITARTQTNPSSTAMIQNDTGKVCARKLLETIHRMKLFFHVSPIFRIVKSFVEVDLVMGGTDLLGEAIEPWSLHQKLPTGLQIWLRVRISCSVCFVWSETWPEIPKVVLTAMEGLVRSTEALIQI